MARKKNTATNLTVVTDTQEAQEVPSLEVPWGNAPNKIISLDEIVAAGPNGMYTHPDVHNPLVAEGLVEVNRAAINAAGEIATRATPKGIASMSKAMPAFEPEPTVDEYPEPVYPEDIEAANGELTPIGNFLIEDSVPIPEVTGAKRRGRANFYPFDQLQVGQSFFVGNKPGKTDMAKALASTVSSAMTRHAQPIEGQFKLNRKGEQVQVMRNTRHFVIRNVDGGARIWRTA